MAMGDKIKDGAAGIFSAHPAPDPKLAKLVQYWTLTHRGKKARGKLRFIPDECMEMIINLKAPVTKASISLCGVQQEPILIKVNRPAEFIGIKFLPGSFYSLFRVPADRFMGKKVTLESAIGGNATRFSEILKYETLESKIKHMDSVLISMAEKKAAIDPAIARAVKDIYKERGSIPVHTLVSRTGHTWPWLIKHFKTWIGVPPHLFCKSIRFNDAVWSLNCGEEAVTVAYKCGYSDHAHFIRSFRRYTGMTPPIFDKRWKHRINLGIQ